ncbi:Adenine nucleotide alpha hydrolases-like protein [Dioscorea alata]|uniref:Adenine nucleotide alpha hydrolases-like protein n=1 Tax=Dioscorea alata TaxID=55571 RepID=A0ACB7UJM4_DIOAL|nr:Adenine nucleotide alpha hydrolases-like protein [Dioscorea alata]
MGRTSPRLPSFCLNRVATRVRVRSPPIETKPISLIEHESSSNADSVHDEKQSTMAFGSGRRIMIVVDSSQEAKTALQWALTHAVQNNDTVVLFDVAKPSKHQGDQSQKDINPKIYNPFCAMKNICQSKRPEVHVELCLVEGKERGPTIVEEAKKQGVSLLVLGQKKRSVTWRLLMMWAGGRVAGGGGGVVEYCIQNASCMTLAVRKKSKRGGGYLITTRRHKDFWLLA